MDGFEGALADRGGRRAGAVAIALAAIVAVASSCVWSSSSAAATTSAAEPARPTPAPSLRPRSPSASSQMSAEQLADQVLLLGFEGTDARRPVPRRGPRARQLGGVLVDAENWVDAVTGTALVDAICEPPGARATGSRRCRRRPGGRRLPRVRRPAARADRARDRRRGAGEAAEDWARETAAALRDAGFDLNLFPVADVATLDSPSPTAPSPTTRATVAELTAAAIRGCDEPGSPARRFTSPASAPPRRTPTGPGDRQPRRGDARRRATCAPFAAAFDEGAPAVVLSLAFYAAYDPVTPGALRRGGRHRPAARRARLRGRRDHRRPRRRRGAVELLGRRRRRSPRSPPAPTWSRSARPRTQSGVREAIVDAVEAASSPTRGSSRPRGACSSSSEARAARRADGR